MQDLEPMHVSSEVELGLIVGSAMLLVATAIATPLLLRSLPADYFVRPPPPRRGLAGFVRTVLGVSLVAAGIVMLVLPGQGLLTIAIGLSILELRSQRRVVVWVLGRPRVASAVQHLRRRAGRAPLILPQTV